MIIMEYIVRRGVSECAYEHYSCSIVSYSLDSVGYIISIPIQTIGLIEYIIIHVSGFCGGPRIWKKLKRRVYPES